jgi:hypothetical protein
MRFGASDIEPIVAEIGAQAKVLQIIHAALVVGVLVFFGFQLVNNPKFTELPTAVPLVPLVAAISGTVFSFIVPKIVRQSTIAQLHTKSPVATAELFNAYQISHIIGMALMEGAIFLVCMALSGLFGEVPRWFLGVPIVLIVIMLLRFPKKSTIAEWIADQRDEMTRQ